MAKPFKVKKLKAMTSPPQAVVRILQTRLVEFYSHWPDLAYEPTPQEVHNLRISGKRLRYSAEMMRDFYPDRLALLLELLKCGQDILGEYQDCVTHHAMLAQDLSRQRQLAAPRQQLKVLQALLKSLDTRQAELLQQFREIWQGLLRPDARQMLETMIAETEEEVTG